MIDPYAPPQGPPAQSEGTGLLEIVRRGFIAIDLLAVGYIIFSLMNAVRMLRNMKDGDPSVLIAVAFFFVAVAGGLVASAWGLHRRKKWAWLTQSLLTIGCVVLAAGVLLTFRAF